MSHAASVPIESTTKARTAQSTSAATKRLSALGHSAFLSMFRTTANFTGRITSKVRLTHCTTQSTRAFRFGTQSETTLTCPRSQSKLLHNYIYSPNEQPMWSLKILVDFKAPILYRNILGVLTLLKPASCKNIGKKLV